MLTIKQITDNTDAVNPRTGEKALQKRQRNH